MKSTYLALTLAILAVVIGAVWYTRSPDAVLTDTGAQYAYTCNSDMSFMLTPAPDLSAVTLSPIPGAAYPPVSLLAESPTDTGRRYRGAGFELHGQGETVTLYVVESGTVYACEQHPKPNEAPFNWGE